jgi:hypothetical protein
VDVLHELLNERELLGAEAALILAQLAVTGHQMRFEFANTSKVLGASSAHALVQFAAVSGRNHLGNMHVADMRQE